MLRRRKYKRYNEETNDEEDEGRRKFDIKEQIRSKRFDQDKERHLQQLSGEDISLKLIQRHGFEKPILVKEPHGLELRVPPKSFLVRDVRNCVGPQRIIDVMDVSTQKNVEMSMKDFCKYYESKHRDKLLNVISLEFSHTELDELVEAPKIVKLLDWVDLVWPKFLKEKQTESTNSITQMMYPKVQKYCLMSVKGSYTDFHIDFGGTSVWYHIIRGKKIFWMIPPTELNLQTFEEWTLSGMQQDVFFGDTVEECFRIELIAGNTFFIPSGWIHAVYTLEDSLVFGGNFLHSFGIENQLKVSKIEDITRVPVKFRYPFYTEILWYVVQHYVFCLTGKNHLHPPPATQESTPEKTPIAGKKSCIQDDDDETDVTIDSELSESDTNKTKMQQSKRKMGKKSKRPVKKRATKVISNEDESTEIDSDIEEEIKQNEKKNSNTCRMTKNSLSRLQYEIDEHDNQRQPSNAAPTDLKQKIKIECTSKSANNSEQLSKNPINHHQHGTEQSTQEKKSHKLLQNSNHTTALTESMLSESVKINGWLGNGTIGCQTTWSNQDVEPKETKGIQLTKIELNGLKALVKHLSKLSGAKKNLPTLIKNSRALLDDCRKLIADHENDDPELAITGHPITPEVLHPKKSDINELIEQFFKPTDTTAPTKSSNSSPTLTKSDSMTLTHQQRLKLNPNNDDKVTVSSNITAPSNSASQASSKNPTSLSQKETKCLSPSKKFSVTTPTSLSTSVSTSSSVPPRPKSPPTRPLSNNQYTSKSKIDSANLLLPGSFADLIAATSTGKKVFDVNSSEITSSFFSAKDQITPKVGPSSPTKANMMSRDSKEKTSKLIPSVPIKIPHQNREQTSTTSLSTTTTESSKSPTNQKAPNSPEPPKVSPQKRFINPAFKPLIKEKLIYASAPYVSPVHASDQSRNSSLYPWQSTSVQPHQQQQQSKSQTQASNPDSNKAPPSVIQAPYKPSTTHHSDSQGQSSCVDKTLQRSSAQPIKANHQAQAIDSSDGPGKTSAVASLTSAGPSSLPIKSEDTGQDLRLNSNLKHDESTTEQKNKISVVNADPYKKTTPDPKPVYLKDSPAGTSQQIVASANQSNFSVPEFSESAIKKPAKPRGPPKKSKEARQVLDNDTSYKGPPTFAPTSVIIMNPGNSGLVQATNRLSSVSQPSMNPSVSGISTIKPKPKARPSKKSKIGDNNIINSNVGSTSNPSPHQLIPTSVARPPLVCGLMASPMNASTKINPQQYLISRPLLLNGIPTFSTAQMQQMTRSPMPIFATPMPSLGLPSMQQGARIVWATQPRIPNPVSSTQNNTTSTHQTSLPTLTTNTTPTSSSASRFGLITGTRLPVAPPPRQTPPNPAQPDNAALLSLATTALSTAPMSSSPALSQLGARSQQAQAIMVGPTVGQSTALLQGQQIFSSFMQRMPLAQHPSAHLGATRPTGQLVFARLPHNTQGQPRYLITQPGSFIPHRPLGPQLVAGQPRSTLAFAAYKPNPPIPVSDQSKSMKAKKVKTS